MIRTNAKEGTRWLAIGLLVSLVALLLKVGAGGGANTDAATQPVGQNGNWALIFSDEFNGASLDSSKWVTCYWWKNHWWKDNGCTNEGNKELQWYQPDGVRVINDTLVMEARKQTVYTATFGQTFDYTSGMITTGRIGSKTSTPAKFVFQYGYVEARVRVPKGQGLWPAFWLLPDNQISTPEIDVMEILGHDPTVQHMNYHYRDSDGVSRSVGTTWTGPDFSADWHTFAADWRPDSIVWYVDGVERWRYTDKAWISATPMYLLLNLAVGGNWPGAPDASTPFPSYYDIDYVRVWQRFVDTP